MKRILSLFLTVMLLMSISGCININLPAKPTDAPTEAPLITDAPTAEPTVTEAATEEPTEAPTDEPIETDAPAAVTGIVDFCMVLEPEKDISLDLDFDGMDDSVFIERSKADDWDDKFEVKITLGSNPSKPFTYTVDYCYDFYAWCVDCDPSDSRLEILISFAQDSDDWTSAALRVSDKGGDIDEFEDYISISSSIEEDFTSDGGFFVYDMTDIFGTYTIVCNMKVTSQGFAMVEEDYLYWGYPVLDIDLLKKFEVQVLNDDGSLGATVTLKKGDTIYPYRTDNQTYVIVELEDGRKAWIEVEIHNWPDYDDWGVFLNGVNQDELADIFYAD